MLVPPDVAENLLGGALAVIRAAGVWESVEWLLAMALSRTFELTERVLVDFIRGERAELGEHRSLQVFDDEEEKHIELFHRVGLAHTRRRPDLAAALDRRWPALEALFAERISPEPYPSRAVWHLSFWASITLFECWTVWLAERLRACPEVQPAWLSAHVAHAREEVQHIATDRAFLACHAGTAPHDLATRRALTVVLDATPAVSRTVLAVVRDLYTDLPLRDEIGAASTIALLTERTFRACREEIPFYAELAASAHSLYGRTLTAASTSAPRRGREAILAYIRAYVARAVGCAEESVPAHTTFPRLGLDSATQIGLAAGLGTFLSARVSEVAAYAFPMPELLADALASAAPEVQEAPAAGLHDGVSARQARLVHLDAALGGATVPDHLVTAWRLEGTVDAEALRAALGDVIARHEALRTTFAVEGDRVVQRVAEAPALPVITMGGAQGPPKPP